ncbi:hypothetical protein KAH37_07910 [bacterium]|nr:hypothetical protein [bacterium]
MKNTKKIRVILVSVVTLLLFVISFAIWWSVRSKPSSERIKASSFDMDSLTRGRVSSNSLSSMMNRSSRKKNVEIAPPPQKVVKKRIFTSSKNSRKDEEILLKYASVRGDRAGAGSGARRGSLREKRGSRGGGVFMVNDKKKVKQRAALHNVKIKVKLTLAIRSSSRTPVIAEVVTEGQKVEKGTKFIGAPTIFSNKRTQIRFSQMRFAGKRVSVQGFAVSGKDPGVPSEVTDISSNVNKTVHAGAIKSVTSIAAGVVGGLGGSAATAANNVISPAGNEVATQEESNKMKEEFRVPAGTVFYIYLE